MLVYKLIFFSAFSLFFQNVGALSNPDLLPQDQAFKVTAAPVSADKIQIKLDIAEGYYLYKDKLKVTTNSAAVQLSDPVFPAGEMKHDEFFGAMETYRHQLEFPIPIKNPTQATTLDILIKHQGCADIGVCYPPQKTAITIDLHASKNSFDPINQIAAGFNNFTNNFFSADLLPADQAFQFFATIKDGQNLQVNWNIAEGYYLYRDKIELTLVNKNTTRLGAYLIPHGISEEDEIFGQVEIFYNELDFTVPVIRSSTAAQTILLQAKYQGCAVRGVCYPPMQKTVELQLPAIAELINTDTTATPSVGLSEQDSIVASLHQDAFWLTLVSFFGFGLLLAFTPCIFPMIPILSGIIVGQGNKVTTARALLLSLSFVLASAATYTVFGIVAALFGSNLQADFQQPWVIIVFSSMFILLSLSMFGFYTLELPKALQARLNSASNQHRDGSLVGAAIMGSLSSLIVGPCVAAPLAGALIYIGKTGDAVLGGSALFMLGLGMGAPLLLLGASAGKLLPKAGTWLNATKAVFGVIMLAVAVWMLDRILPAPVTMFLWAMLLIIPAVYLSAIDPLPNNAGNWRRLWKGVGLISLIYGVLLLIGFGMGNTNPLKPLHGTGRGHAQEEAGIIFQRVASLAELEKRVSQASANNQWVMLDFYADWCISCKEMEAYTFTDPQVKQLLSQFVLLQADVTQHSATDKALLQRFNLIGPPAILFFDPDQQEQTQIRVVGYQDAETFIATLKKSQL